MNQKKNLQVLHLDPHNEKALYRRGQANFALKNYETALADLKHAEKISPKNKAVQKLLEEVRQENKSYNDLQKQRLSKFFRDQKEKSTSIGHHWDKIEGCDIEGFLIYCHCWLLWYAIDAIEFWYLTFEMYT